MPAGFDGGGWRRVNQSRGRPAASAALAGPAEMPSGISGSRRRHDADDRLHDHRLVGGRRRVRDRVVAERRAGPEARAAQHAHQHHVSARRC
jgi:hypothetical protein